MFVRYALLGDAVHRTSGKWNVIGTFNLVWSKTFPARCPPMGILIRLEGDHREIGKHTLRIDFVDETGSRLSGPEPEEFTFEQPAVAGFPVAHETGLAVVNLDLPKAGNYDFVIRVDDIYLDSVPLYVRDATDHPARRAT